MTNGFHSSYTGDLMLARQLHKARAVLAVPVEATSEQIRSAFRCMVKYHHPDNTEDAMEAALNGHIPDQRYTLQTMRDAKDLLLKHLGDDNG